MTSLAGDHLVATGDAARLSGGLAGTRLLDPLWTRRVHVSRLPRLASRSLSSRYLPPPVALFRRLRPDRTRGSTGLRHRSSGPAPPGPPRSQKPCGTPLRGALSCAHLRACSPRQAIFYILCVPRSRCTMLAAISSYEVPTAGAAESLRPTWRGKIGFDYCDRWLWLGNGGVTRKQLSTLRRG